MDKKHHGQEVLATRDRSTPKRAGYSLLDVPRAASRLGCSERFIRRLVQERRIPFFKLAGTKVRFDEIELDLWLDGQRVEAIR